MTNDDTAHVPTPADPPVPAGAHGPDEHSGVVEQKKSFSETVSSLVKRMLLALIGVAILVVPQLTEGAYGYFGARQLLGDALTSTHILDIGGGSLQVAGEKTTFGEALGQKVWHRHLCQEIRNCETVPCTLQPMTGDELAIARQLVAEKLKGVATALPERVSMTAISRPVSRGVLPAIDKLAGGNGSRKSFQRGELSAAIERLARRRAGAKMGWYIHASVYLLVNLLLVALSVGSGRYWAVFPALGWGLGLLLHGLGVWLSLGGGGLQQRLIDQERARLSSQRDPW